MSISIFNHFSIDEYLVFLGFCTYKLSYTKACIYAFIFVLNVPGNFYKWNSKDIKIVFIISDKLPFKQIEINYTLTNTYMKWSPSVGSDSLRPHGTVAHQDPWDFPGKNTGVGLPFPSPEDLSNQGIEPASPAWQADSLPLSHLGSPNTHTHTKHTHTSHTHTHTHTPLSCSPSPFHLHNQAAILCLEYSPFHPSPCLSY